MLSFLTCAHFLQNCPALVPVPDQNNPVVFRLLKGSLKPYRKLAECCRLIPVNAKSHSIFFFFFGKVNECHLEIITPEDRSFIGTDS